MSYIGERVFSPADQDTFAALSGDYNPMHLDAVYARRLFFGTPVVHGIHVLLWSLDTLSVECGEGPVEIDELKAVFNKPIAVGAPVSLRQLPVKTGENAAIRARLFVNEAPVATISARFRTKPETSVGSIRTDQPGRSAPRELKRDELEGVKGSLPLHLPTDGATGLFPRLSRYLSPGQLATILATTRLVGGQCPGLNSVFAELALSWSAEEQETLNYEVQRFDKRFNLATLDVSGCRLSGRLLAFYRPDNHVQPSYREIIELVPPSAFAGCRALVIGGSRGLGEIAAKLLCAGGAEVRLTYLRGAEDAARVVADIQSGGGSAGAVEFDSLAPEISPSLTDSGTWQPTHALYFATPPIFTGSKGVFSRRLFDQFNAFYVLAFSRLFSHLRALGTTHFFLPSSSALDELPADMVEYIAAKAAAEAAALAMEKNHAGVVIAQPRLPRLATDQTMTIAESEEGDPVPVMYAALSRFAGK